MYIIKGKRAGKIEPSTFSALGIQESDIEEILRRNVDVLCDDEESMLIVGQQVKNEKHGRSDLTAVDNNGSLVLIEIKRDRKDIENRSEPLEFQAIRYAASYATIESADELVKKVYAPYIEKHHNEFKPGELTSYEFGVRKLNEFLRANEAEKSFNKRQRVVLVSSGFDEQTLSAVAWLNSNDVDISCYKLTPYKLNEELYLYPERILPPANYDDYYVNLLDKPLASATRRRKTTRRVLPKIDAMLDWGVIKEGDLIVAKGRESEGILQANGNVIVDGKEKSMQAWLKEVFGWASVHTYVFAVHKESGKTLSQIREEYMEQQGLADASPDL